MGFEPERVRPSTNWRKTNEFAGADDDAAILDADVRTRSAPADVLGALTGEAGFTREQVSKITVADQTTYVAVEARDREAVRRLSRRARSRARR